MPNGTSQKYSDVTLDDVMDFLVTKIATKEDLKNFFTKEEVRGEIGKLRSDMIDYVDKRATQTEGTIAKLLYKEDAKLGTTLDLLTHKKVFTPAETQKIKAMPPFTQYGKQE